MPLRYDDRFARMFGICRYAPDDGGDGGEAPGDGGGDEAPEGGGDADAPLDPAAEIAKWKGLARRHETAAKKNADAAKRLQEIEESGKSELEKAQAAATAAEQRISETTRELTRLRVAMRKGLTEAMAKRLTGETEEELEADADELLTLFKAETEDETDRSIPRRPRERLRPGTGPDKEPEPNAKEIVDKIMASAF